jgi:arsenate reductase (thioredoxin)
MEHEIYTELVKCIERFKNDFLKIPAERKAILHEISTYVTAKRQKNEAAQLNFICTHNSRRSHISQLWAQACAAYYQIDSVYCFSGGTEATAFNPRAVNAMREAGFKIIPTDQSDNPRYEVRFSNSHPALIAFSKVYSDPFNPTSHFAAIMTCSHADENCPLVIGAEKRISLPFNDPKDFDGTPIEAEKYRERVLEIGMEISYAFSIIV